MQIANLTTGQHPFAYQGWYRPWRVWHEFSTEREDLLHRTLQLWYRRDGLPRCMNSLNAWNWWFFYKAFRGLWCTSGKCVGMGR